MCDLESRGGISLHEVFGHGCKGFEGVGVFCSFYVDLPRVFLSFIADRISTHLKPSLKGSLATNGPRILDVRSIREWTR